MKIGDFYRNKKSGDLVVITKVTKAENTTIYKIIQFEFLTDVHDTTYSYGIYAFVAMYKKEKE